MGVDRLTTCGVFAYCQSDLRVFRRLPPSFKKLNRVSKGHILVNPLAVFYSFLYRLEKEQLE
jgi:hypothetical protein